MRVPPPLRALLRGAIDYAGLHPPAALPMAEAVARYAEYRAGDDQWALGRFVVAAGRLDELARSRAALDDDAGPWPLAVLVGSDPRADAALVARHAGDGSLLRVESLESRIASAAEGARLREAFESASEIYCEISSAHDPRGLLRELAPLRLRAKIRTGGTTPEAIPESAEVARFLAACIEAGVPFKATAGLHHPLRADRPLTYEPGAPHAIMHGWVNVFLAAALLVDGGSEREARTLLDELDPASLDVRATEIAWRGRVVPIAAIERLRAGLLVSFGSCSFREPLDELAALPALLQTT